MCRSLPHRPSGARLPIGYKPAPETADAIGYRYEGNGHGLSLFLTMVNDLVPSRKCAFNRVCDKALTVNSTKKL